MSETEDIEDRVLRVPGHGHPAARKRSGNRWISIVSLVALAVLASQGLGDSVRAFNGQRVYFRNLPEAPAGADGPNAREKNQFLSTNWPIARLLRSTEEIVQPGEKILIFRLAEIGFYSDLPFVYLIDPEIAPVFLEPTAAAMVEALLARDIKYLYVPGYSLPEIYGSPVADIVSSPDLGDVLADHDGFKLIRLRSAPRTETEVEVARVDFTRDPQARREWRGFPLRASGALSTAPLGVAASYASAGFFEARSGGNLLVSRNDYVQLQHTDLDARQPALVANFTDIPPSSGLIAVHADVEARGRVEIVVVSAVEGGGPPATHVIWTGVLRDRRKELSGFFVDAPAPPVAGVSPLRVHRVFFRLRGPGYMRVRGWRATLRPLPTPTFETASSVRPTDFGWTLPGWNNDSPIVAGALAGGGREPVTVRQLDARQPIRADGPASFVRGVEPAPTSTRIEARAEVTGDGVGEVYLVYKCQGDADDTLAPLGAFALSGEVRTVTRLVDARCTPASARLAFVVQKPEGIFLRKRDRAAVSSVTVHSQALHLVVTSKDGQTARIPFETLTDIYFNGRERETPPAPAETP